MSAELETLTESSAAAKKTPELMSYLAEHGASFSFRMQTDLDLAPWELVEALWELAWKGLVTNDGFEAVRIGIRSDFKLSKAGRPDESSLRPSPLLGPTRIELRSRIRRQVARRVLSTPGGDGVL